LGEWHDIAIGTGRIIPGGSYALCGDPVIDSRDGQVYPTTLIGFQCWMTKNMNVGSMISPPYNQDDDGDLEKYCYDNSSANCDYYGGLYQWGEALQYSEEVNAQGICPAGWHVASHGDWCELANFVDYYGGGVL